MKRGISHLNHFHPTTHLLMTIAILFITLSCELLTSLVEYICYVRMRLENHKKNSTSLLFYLLHIYAITVVYLLTLSYPEVLLCTQIVKKLSNGHSRQIRETGALLAPMCRGESHFSQKLAKARVGESGESARHGSASVGEFGKSAQHSSAQARMIR